MTNEEWKTLALLIPPVSVLIGRLWSMVEHIKTSKEVKKTHSDIAEIKIYINGEMAKRLEEARQEGIKEGIKKFTI